MAKLNTKSGLFTSTYDDIRRELRLPDGAEHAHVMLLTAMQMARKAALKLGHVPCGSGASLECSRCGASLTVDQSDGFEVRGNLGRDRCGV